MSDYKTINFEGGLGGNIKAYNDGEIIIEGKPYGKFDGDRINPYVYGNPTLKIDDCGGYIYGAYDGITYGKLMFCGETLTGVEVYVSPFKNESNTVQSSSPSAGSMTEFVLDKTFNAYSNFEKKPKSSGYENGTGIIGKILIGILIASSILILIMGILSDK